MVKRKKKMLIYRCCRKQNRQRFIPILYIIIMYCIYIYTCIVVRLDVIYKGAYLD